MELFLDRVYPETIMTIGVLSRNTSLHCIWIQAIKIGKGISDLMVRNHAFYKIPEAEVIYCTMEQSGTQTYKLHPKRWNTESITSSLLIPCLKFPQGRNTHTALSKTHKNNLSVECKNGFSLPLGGFLGFPEFLGLEVFLGDLVR